MSRGFEGLGVSGFRGFGQEMVSSDPPVEYSARNDSITLSAITHADRPAVHPGLLDGLVARVP